MTTILGKYEIETILGKGKFGTVYKGKRIKDQEPVAIKMEALPMNSPHSYKILKHETTMLNYLQKHNCGKYIPTIYWYGIYNLYPTLVMTYYQNSLEDYMKYKTIDQEKRNKIMVLLLEILGKIHKQYVIHRDIKPQNIMMKEGELYLIDFGLATFYVDDNFKHVECKQETEYILGTPKYISYNIHEGIEPSRRDDLISLGYLYMEIMVKTLPWTTIVVDSANIQMDPTCTMYPLNQERKRLKSYENLCTILGQDSRNELGKDSRNELGKEPDPTIIYKYMKACYELEYKETIDYDEWIREFMCSSI